VESDLAKATEFEDNLHELFCLLFESQGHTKIAGALRRGLIDIVRGRGSNEVYVRVFVGPLDALCPETRRALAQGCEALFQGVQITLEVINLPKRYMEWGLNNCFFKTESVLSHDRLSFRSPAEISVYNEFKKRKVMVFPNAAAVLGETTEKKEPDFLVCFGGKWGILEVMGETYHDGSTAVKDHGRARRFKEYGLLCVEFFPAKRCLSDPSGVVDEFLAILSRH
jgi:hypothetical protein